MAEKYSGEIKSVFNSAIAQLQRLDSLWKDCNRHSRDNQFIKWNQDLDTIFRELSDWTIDEDEEFKKFNDFNKALVQAGLFEPVTEKGFEIKNAKQSAEKFSKIYEILMKKEILIRRLQNKQGRAGVVEDSVEDYMDEGF